MYIHLFTLIPQLFVFVFTLCVLNEASDLYLTCTYMRRLVSLCHISLYKFASSFICFDIILSLGEIELCKYLVHHRWLSVCTVYRRSCHSQVIWQAWNGSCTSTCHLYYPPEITRDPWTPSGRLSVKPHKLRIIFVIWTTPV